MLPDAYGVCTGAKRGTFRKHYGFRIQTSSVNRYGESSANGFKTGRLFYNLGIKIPMPDKMENGSQYLLAKAGMQKQVDDFIAQHEQGRRKSSSAGSRYFW